MAAAVEVAARPVSSSRTTSGIKVDAWVEEPNASNAVAARSSAADAASATSSSAAWRGHRPLGVLQPLPKDVEAQQLAALDAALELMEEATSAARASQGSNVIATRAHACGATVEVDFAFPDTWSAVIEQRMSRLPLGLMAAAALFHEADLIKLPPWPGCVDGCGSNCKDAVEQPANRLSTRSGASPRSRLPHIEGIGVLHRFHHNDLLLNPRVAPWGPFPGADSIHAVALFAPPERGAVLVYAQSPPEGATSHRGVALHPPGWRRKRNILKGATWLVRPTFGGDGSTVDCVVYLKAKLPVPAWLIPPPLIRWAIGPFVAKLMPVVQELGAGALGREEESEIGRRVRSDASGWYGALRAWLGGGAQDDAEPTAARTASSSDAPM